MKEFQIYMHINVFEYDYCKTICDFPDVFKQCKQMGFDGIEVRGKSVISSLTDNEYHAYIFEQASLAGLNVTFGFTSDVLNSDATSREESFNKLSTLIEFAGSHRTTFLNVFSSPIICPSKSYFDFGDNGSAYANESHWSMTVEFFKRIATIAQKNGVTLCLEMHNCYLHDLAGPTKRLIDMIGSPYVKANFDYGNMYLNPKGEGIEEAISIMQGSIGYVHLKNVMMLKPFFDKPYFWPAKLSDGDINNYLLIRELMRYGFDGVFTIETLFKGDRRQLAREDLQYVRMLISEFK